MLSAGMENTQLKPAMLMLSTCHLDVARQLRGQNGTETQQSKHHLSQACDGFRRVYGAFELPPPASAVATTRVTAPPPTPSLSQPATAPPAPPPPSQARAQHPPGSPVPSSPRHGQVKMLEREVQSLRDRQQNQIESLARTRAAKRKLEDELEREAHRRRRAEDALADAERRLADARRAEVRAEELRARVDALEPKVREGEEQARRTKEYFGKLGFAFLKAARGDMGDVPTPPVRM